MTFRPVPRSAPLLAVVLALVALPGRPALACSVTCDPPTPTACTCSGTDPTCVLTGHHTVAAGAVVDCTGRNITIPANTSITVTNGFVTVKAQNLTIDHEGFIRAERTGTSTAAYGVHTELTGAFVCDGWIDAAGVGGGGSIVIEAAGNVSLLPGGTYALKADPTSAGAPGGTVEITSGGDVDVNDAIYARASDTASSPDVAPGGHVQIIAAGTLTARKPINVLGRRSSGGRIILTAEGALSVQDHLKAEGHGVDADGGEVLLTGDPVTVSALVSAQGGVGQALGGHSAGGTVRVHAGSAGAVLGAEVNVTGGSEGSGLDGGAIVVESEGDLMVGGGAVLRTKSDNNGGNGGEVVLASEGTLTLQSGATIDSRGHYAGGNQGTGAAVRLSGCTVTVQAGATIDARGYHGGTVALTAHERLTVSSTASVLAAASGGAAGRIVVMSRVDGWCQAAPTQGCALSWKCSDLI